MDARLDNPIWHALADQRAGRPGRARRRRRPLVPGGDHPGRGSASPTRPATRPWGRSWPGARLLVGLFVEPGRPLPASLVAGERATIVQDESTEGAPPVADEAGLLALGANDVPEMVALAEATGPARSRPAPSRWARASGPGDGSTTRWSPGSAPRRNPVPGQALGDRGRRGGRARVAPASSSTRRAVTPSPSIGGQRSGRCITVPADALDHRAGRRNHVGHRRIRARSGTSSAAGDASWLLAPPHTAHARSDRAVGDQ